MNTLVTTKTASVLAALGLLAAAGTVSAQFYIYDNSTTPTGTSFLDPTPFPRVADELTLGPGPRNADILSIALSGLGVSGNEAVQLNIYALDGPPDVYGSGFPGPGTSLFSGGGPLNWAPGDHNDEWFSFDLGGVLLPNTVAVSYSFLGVDPNEVVGPSLYDPATVGSSFYDYWRDDVGAGGFGLAILGAGGVPAANFGIRIAVVPEASTVWGLGGLGALLGLTLYRRFSRKA